MLWFKIKIVFLIISYIVCAFLYSNCFTQLFRVYDLQFMDVLYEVEAHDAEILSIEYSDPSSSKAILYSAKLFLANITFVIL